MQRAFNGIAILYFFLGKNNNKLSAVPICVHERREHRRIITYMIILLYI